MQKTSIQIQKRLKFLPFSLIFPFVLIFSVLKSVMAQDESLYYLPSTQTAPVAIANVPSRTVVPSVIQSDSVVQTHQNTVPSTYTAQTSPPMQPMLFQPPFQTGNVPPHPNEGVYLIAPPTAGTPYAVQPYIPPQPFSQQQVPPTQPQYPYPQTFSYPSSPLPQYSQYSQPHHQDPVYVASAVREPYSNSYAQPSIATPPRTPSQTQPQQPQEHPLMPVICWAKQERPNIERINDYTAILRKQENIGGRLQEGNIMEVKIRHRPFSVYLKFIVPKNMNGQEVIYVEGQNNGKMWAHGVGIKKLAGTQSLDPAGTLAMSGNKYPLTMIGMLNLIDKLLEVGESDVRYGECKVLYYENVKMGSRLCTCVEVTHPKKYKEFRFHIARIYVDNELNLPIRYESYDWPKNSNDKPELIEAYSYDNLRINVGLTDKDFSTSNKDYNF
ncbi:MAG: DUF1571 domain-containing protein [Planctomycetaceae bacterium]|jgi:hypothetical protein|nr:DUF1571 domain-containing protein [Planctomycetaceae bacterium]